ncbi:MAG: TonB-dependent receptor, partial [Bacteroidota bacterium]
YLDISGRNDWSSTLPAENNSYFYPSASLSAILTDAFDLQSKILSYAKIRAGYSGVGGATQPYQITQTFSPTVQWDATTPLFSVSSSIANSTLRPESVTNKEVGLDLRFLGNRIGLDVTYYQQTTTDLIMPLTVSRATGYSSTLINAGEVRNNGIEMMLTAAIVDNPKFGWDVGFNYARNRNEIVELYTDESGNELETLVLTSRRGLSLEARVGQAYGTLFGSGYARVAEGEFAGQVIYEDGIPVKDPDLKILGNTMPDWIGGLSNSFRIGPVTISALIDARIGGEIAEESSSIAHQTGVAPMTELGREEGVIGIGAMNVGDADNPVYAANDVVAPTRNVVGALSVRYANEGAVFDATYVKLREASIRYVLPTKLTEKIGFIRGASVSLIGRNLAMLYSNHENVDPEFNVYGGNLQGALFYTTIPSTRSLGVNLNLTF